MPDRNQSSNTGSPQQRPAPTTDEEAAKSRSRQKQAQPGRGQEQDQEQEDVERVEIGDPVPEDNRTVRAREQGETGEDEDLPTDDDSVESPPRH